MSIDLMLVKYAVWNVHVEDAILQHDTKYGAKNLHVEPF